MSDTVTVASTLAAIRAAKKPMTRRVPIVADPDLAEAMADARSAYDVAMAKHRERPADGSLQDIADRAADRLEEAQAAAEAATFVFVFQALGRVAWDELVTTHRPTDKQRTEHRRGGGQGEIEWNPDTFPPAVVAASLVEPALSEAEVRELWDDPNWNLAELMALFNAAVAVNQQRRVVEVP